VTAVPRLTDPAPRPVTEPPSASRTPYTHTEHGVARSDPYRWLGAVGDPAVLAHLTAERAFYDASCLHLEPLTSALRAAILSRLPMTDESARWVRRRFTYWTLHRVNSEYA
jgi:oligopeptidase B